MAWLSGSLTMPTDAGGPRAGGCRLQMPNIMRVAVPGGEAIAFVADVSIAIAGGATATIPGGVFASIGGSLALATTTTYYVTYVTVAAPSVLLACRQQDFAAIYAAADVVAIGYHTDQYDLRLPVPGSIAIAGGLVSRLAYAAHFDASHLLTSIRVSAGSARTTTGTVIPFAAAYLPVPGGVAGTYLVCLTASGVLFLASAAPVGSFPIAQVQVLARPTNTFDAPLASGGAAIYPTSPTKLFENGATITPAAGLSSLPTTAYRTDNHTPDGNHDFNRYYNDTPPSDGTGGYLLPSSANVALAAGQIPPLANSTSWADPLCALSLAAFSGTVGGAPNAVLTPGTPHGPAITVSGPVGDKTVATTTDLAYWQSSLFVVLVSYGDSTVTISEAPLRYIGVANVTGPGWIGEPAIWVTHSGAQLLAEYMAP